MFGLFPRILNELFILFILSLVLNVNYQVLKKKKKKKLPIDK